MESIYARTTYLDFEVLLIENNSKEEATLPDHARLQKRHPEKSAGADLAGQGLSITVR